jgi:outer membrane protein assembly factor BamB
MPARRMPARRMPARRMPAMTRALTLGIAVLLVSGCSWFSWLPWVDDDDEEDALEPAKLVDFDEEVKIERLWKTSIGDGLGKKYIRLSPIVIADRVYAADGYGTVRAVDRFTGKKVWETSLDGADSGFFDSLNFYDRTDTSFVSGGLGAGEGKVLMGLTSGEVVALEASDGSIAWRVNVGSEVLCKPTVSGGKVFLQTIDGRLMALDAASGEQVWTFVNQVPILTLRGTGSPVMMGDVVLAGFANGMVMAFRAATGEPVWEHRVQLPEGRSELDRMVDIDSVPLVAGPLVYVVAYHGKLKALRRDDGNPLWERDYSSFLDLAEGYGNVYVIDDRDVIAAVDSSSSETAWSQEALWRRKLTSPVAFSNYVVVGDDDGYLHVLAQSDGRFVGRRKLDGDGLRSEMVIAEGRTIYVLTNGGSLQALEIAVR